MLSGDKRPMSMPGQPNRTLLGEPVGSRKDGKKSWKLLKYKLKQRKAGSGSAWTSTFHVPASDVPLHPNKNRSMTRPSNSDDNAPSGVDLRSRSAMLQRNATRTLDRGSASARFDNSFGNVGREEVEESQGEFPEAAGGEGGGGGGEKKVSMSLMALLAETDREMGLDGSTYMMGDDDDEEYEDEYEDEDEGGRETEEEYSTCCVCMVRHKGSASTPCGHTFCRLCSKELHVQKGNCPHCNNFILEILDIF